MQIREAVGVKRGDVVVVVGGGGKTTIIEKMAEELLAAGGKVIITTTTKIFAPTNGGPHLLVLTDKDEVFIDTIERSFNEYGLIYVGKDINRENKLLGISAPEVRALHGLSAPDYLLIEGDGSKGRPFKAPRVNEPVVPEIATVVIVVVGVDCIGKALVEKYFYAIDQIKSLTGLEYGEVVNEETIVDIMLHPLGYKKSAPINARWIPFINKVESQTDEIKAKKTAKLLISRGVEKVVIGAAKANSSICCIK
ncbi:selenium cofactor biosynthesis protein YqeC [Desulfoscipio gibsoniae]